ncbi:MAG: exo-alpha-sialidase [Proteiniphilum sp.]|uniref:sugar-binding protein n=1 Tax=Proteiniphilum sp. TaxID=1926877 RepID=UPI002ABB38D6|nr:exo-alpha-sialidase [Proteiniphilum sp.]MDY9917545.1 exo-alpha-sialidase [Proteiniphilum sp.]
MERFFRTTVLLAICCAFIACGDKDNGPENTDPGNGGTPEPVTFSITPVEKLNQGTLAVNSHAGVVSRSSLKMNFRSYIELDNSSLGVDKPHYPRIKKMANGNYIMFFHNNQIGASCYYAVAQNLKSWTPKGKLFSNYSITDSKGNANERRFSNCDALVLSNGNILAVASYRADKGYKELPLDAGIALSVSTDNGARWSAPVEIYQGVNWEPYLLELPSGEIHCYFTDSNRTNTNATDTGTAMIVSKDGGKTWTPAFSNPPYYVIRMKWEQDGNTYFNHQMPSVIKLNGGNKLAAAMETNYFGKYYISFAYSPENGEWQHLNMDQEGPVDSDNLSFEGSAPYLVQFPSGETVVSYNKSSTFYMKMGDVGAQNFGEAYAPFSGGGFWGSLQTDGSHQLLGIMPHTSTGKIMLAQFILNHRIEAVRRSVKVDSDNSEWANTDHALFVGGKSQAQATLRCAFDNDNLYFLAEVLDKDIAKDDYTEIFICPVTDDDKLTDKACRIRVSHDGLRSTGIYENGWKDANLGVSASAVFEGTISRNHDEDHGYFVEISIPRSKLSIKEGELLVNFSISDNQGGLDAIHDTSSTNTAKWIPITGL